MSFSQGGFIFFHYILVLVGGLLWRPKVVVKQNNRGPTFQSSTIHPPLSTIHPLQIHYEHPPSTLHPPLSTIQLTYPSIHPSTTNRSAHSHIHQDIGPSFTFFCSSQYSQTPPDRVHVNSQICHNVRCIPKNISIQ